MLRLKSKRVQRGNKLGFAIFAFLIRCFGLQSGYFLLFFVCLYYFLFDSNARFLASCYLQKRFPDKKMAGLWGSVLKLFFCQGKHLIDLYAVIREIPYFDVELKDFDKFKALAEISSKGVVLVTSHLGNWQLALKGFQGLDKPVYLLMREEDNSAVKRFLSVDNVSERIRLVSPDQFLGGIVEIMGILAEGGIVAIMGDRAYSADTVEVEFLKNKAYFPYSAFHIAAKAECPLVFLQTSKVSAKEYSIDFGKVMNVRYEPGKSKKEQLCAWVHEYVKFLEEFVMKYPYQCFIFQDVWKKT